MPTKNPRLNIVLEPDIYQVCKEIAHKQGVSISSAAKNLLLQALEFYEDAHWAKIAEKRAGQFSYDKALTHEEVWK